MEIESQALISDPTTITQPQNIHLQEVKEDTVKTKPPDLHEDVTTKLIKLMDIGSNVDLKT